MRIGLDSMGGDRAPTVEVHGALEARKSLGDDDKLVLIGPESLLRQELLKAVDAMGGQGDGWEDDIEIVHAEQVIDRKSVV